MARSSPTNLEHVEAAAARRRSMIVAAIRRHPASRPESVRQPSAAELIEPEIARARRYERHVGVICVPMHHQVVIEIVRGSIRETDQATVSRDGVVVVLPETDAPGVGVCAERLAAEIGIDARTIGAVSFPDEALTVGHVVHLLSERTAAADGRVPTKSTPAA